MTSGKKMIAFLGTGLMGAPMVRCLLKAGFPVTVWNRDGAKAAPLVADGAKQVQSPADAVAGAEVVFTMLTNGAAVAEVLFEKGVAGAMSKDAIFVDCSSIAPSIAKENARLLGEYGIRSLDAPVSGGTAGAAAGTLAIMAGGDAADVEALKDVFAALGRVTHVGPSGAGQICKLANQQIVAVTIGAVAEAMILAEAGGASRAAFRDAIRGGFAESRILELHGGRMVNRDFVPGGASANQLKDLDAVMAMADSLSLTLPLTRQVRQAFADFVAEGGAEKDHSGLLLHLEKLNRKDQA
ncbi:NAD(P)-dependent oxidoreductase [Pseudorhizobium endolithicum]|uniref:NAD(P)-dependent oxidoreductase n=1 Tax=Pseudorhizobium endolithicum TaxID=1191678 RepID=A0ABM8PTY0_9HYPH|nr:NAD(P)-dependent oxidoreductase [Pseudorhizobium endolithicum]CAD7048358.1 NAD(P)-dependent oxidoreductase [Pseudorhizobium endolithicum]